MHNVICTSAKYSLADGSKPEFYGAGKGKLSNSSASSKLKDYFVIHRMFRSEMEYISLLGRGRPRNKGQMTSCFKDNRPGYCVKESNISFSISSHV
ncbi:hypothetical protein RCJ22_08985, partial [Vibrio sp. FNV 38]|nr:hypothetical protein [Vibrio sp. FNV 38]